LDTLVTSLKEDLNVRTIFNIPIFGGIPVYESVVVTWIIIGVLLVACLLMTRNLSVEHPRKRQLLLEGCITKLYDFFGETIGENGKRYVPYLLSVLIFIGCANLIGIIGFKPPTKDMNVTIALSVMSIVLIEASGVVAKGPKKFLHSFAEPMAVITPINILEIFIRPLSLCMRLFGNVLGSYVIMELLKLVIPAIVPALASLYFDIFDGLIQAYVFVFLTSLFIKESID
jgi:F-type H+-transporting ATPase subunit a